MNPKDPIPYLQRSASYFDMGQYNKSIKDFWKFADQVKKTPEKIPFSTPEFTIGFAKGLPKGVYESGKGLLLFLGDLVSHPIHTSTQMYHALGALARLVRDDQWGMIAEALSPEVHQLVTQWDTLTSSKRGELAGYAFGKHGADILTPGAIVKIASKSAKVAQELTAIFKNLQKAEGMLVLETVAGVENVTKVEKVIRAGKKTTALGKKLGFTPEKMGQLKQAGKLETTVAEANKRLKLLMQKSISIKESTFSLEERQILQVTPLKLAPLEKRAMVQWWQQTAPKLGALSCKYEGKPLYRAIRREFSTEPLSELQIRKLLHHAGYKTYPRPTGLYSDFIVELADIKGRHGLSKNRND